MKSSTSLLAIAAVLFGQTPADAWAADDHVPAPPALRPVQDKPCSLQDYVAPPNVTLVTARAFSTPVAYCRIDGYVTTNNPGPNRVNFMVAMPEAWRGRYLFTAQGGAAGFVPDPNPIFLQRGYAVASTDKGVRTSGILDFSFQSDPAMSIDWAHRGIHVSTTAAHAIAQQRYGGERIYRYISGCSGGGDATLTEAEKYPEDFDAFIGAAMTTTANNRFMWGAIAQRLHKDPSAWISQADMSRVADVIMAEYDDSDGAHDGLIWDPTKIELKRGSFGFLNDAQFGTLQLLQNGFQSTPEFSYPGYWMGNPAAMSSALLGTNPPPWQSLEDGPKLFVVAETGAQGTHGGNYSLLTDMDYSDTAQLAADWELRKATGRTVFGPENLQGLSRSGNKLVLYSGASEEAIPPENIRGYTAGADRIYGERRPNFIRTFFAPGMYHCSGGVGQPTNVPERMIEAAARWVETGQAPDEIIVSNPAIDPAQGFAGTPGAAQANTPVTRTYRLCAYPRRAQFKGGLANPQGLDVKDADNWTCEA